MDLQVLIVGGGIQGTSLLHDLASRHISGVHLVEQKRLAAGTSSRSTKLIHGGLRYLEHLAQWPLVRDSLRERSNLLRILRGVVQPLPFVIPNFPGGRPEWMVRLGLALYDSLGGDSGLPRSHKLSNADVKRYAPYLKDEIIEQKMNGAFLYYDAQMIDDVVVRLSAEAARKLGASYQENTDVESVVEIESGFRVTLNAAGKRSEITTRVIINAGGPWANANLLKWGYTPNVSCLLNVGSHLVFSPESFAAKPAESAAVLLQNSDGRVVFFIPWDGKWLLGTTESILADTPDALIPPESDRKYLLDAISDYVDLTHAHQVEMFAGIRTMPIAKKKHSKTFSDAWRTDPFSSPYYIKKFTSNISALSRESIVDEVVPNLISLYGGKYTTFRSHSERLGNILSRRLALGGKSATVVSESWFLEEILRETPHLFRSNPELRRL